jgi:hypothetical protein
MLGVVGMHKAGGDDDKIGCEEGIAQHFSENNDFGGVNSAVVRWRECDNTRASLLFPETEGGGIKMGSDGLVHVAPDPWEAAVRPWHKFVLRWWIELVEGVCRLQWWCYIDYGGGRGFGPVR